MRDILIPHEMTWEGLRKEHPRKVFHCGVSAVDDWIQSQALQHQAKHLSVTKVLLDTDRAIAGYFTIATGQIDFSDLPQEIIRKLPKRALPVAILAWLGVDSSRQGSGLGRILLAQALRDCYEAGKTFAFVAVILDALDDRAKSFYQQWDFAELPGHPYRLFLTAGQLDALMKSI